MEMQRGESGSLSQTIPDTIYIHAKINPITSLWLESSFRNMLWMDGLQQSHLDWVQRNQTKIRADTYKGLTDALAIDPQMDTQNLGQCVVLPSSFSGSSRNMIQHCQDALAINCYFRGADLFLTMTANPNWQEVKEALLPAQTPADRPDLVDCVFHLKVQELLDDIFKKNCLGKAVACIWTIEFQKRGLPHIHMIIFLHSDSKLHTPEDIDTLLSASFQMRMRNLSSLSWSRSSWYTLPVVLTIPCSLHA